MDQAEFERLLAKVARPTQPPIAGAGMEANELDTEALAEVVEQLTPTELDAQGRRPDGTLYSEAPAQEPALSDATGLDAAVGGGIKSVFETKDFLFGDTAPEDRSEFRASVEDTVELRKKQSMLDGFSAGVGQFAVGIIGLGKFAQGAKALPWFGKGLNAMDATRKGKVALETGKAATVGAVAFDPYEERLSNLVQGTPLANPLNAWLAADPDDSAAEGRMKAALESIGLDAAILGTFTAGVKIWKHLRKGDTVAASKVASQFEADVAAAKEVDGASPAIPEGSHQGALEGPGAQATASPTGDTSTAPGSREGNLTALGEDMEVQPQVISTPTEAAAREGVDLAAQTRAQRPRVQFADEDTASVLDGMTADADAMTKHGGWYEAIQAGHTFGRGEGIPYVKFNADADVDDFMARVVDAAEEQLDGLKGGAVMSDARVAKLVDQRAALFNEDPAQVIGLIQQAGQNSTHMIAEMQAGYLISARMFQDTYALANRVRMGDFAEFGSKEAALDALKQRLSLAASVYGASRSMTAAAGRSMRFMRNDFKLAPEAVSRLKELDGDQLAELLVNTGGNPRNIARVANPTLWTKITDFGQFLLINNLVSGPKTQFINILTNSYMVGARPMERILGSVVPAFKGDIRSRAILQESVKQYTYMGSALMEGFGLARKAFLLNDSVLSPHRSEMWGGAQTGAPNAAQQAAGAPWKPWDSIPNLLHNSLLVGTNAIGLPTRTLGTVDELVKQTVYRSKVMARAHMEAVQQGAESGLEGNNLKTFVKTYVRDKLDAAFDAQGRGLDAEALREALIATFQQELLPETLGKSVNNFVVSHPASRLVLPFVKTPTNVLRYGWKMSPGLNLLQSEYRQMIRGQMGREAQAQAYGQMTMGTMFLGAAAWLVSQGSLTGAGPKDPKQRQGLMATGWQPYSFVSENADGTKTYVPFNRYDPVALPFGIVADLQDTIAALGDEDPEDNPGFMEATGALFIAISKQFTSKTYLMGIGSFMDAMQDPDKNMERVGGQMVANFIPYSAALRQLNPDPYLREARDVADKVMATIPGLSENVPARYDAWGNPIVMRKGLWNSDEDSTVDREVQRLAIEGGATVVRPQPVHDGVDLRDLIMEDGRNAYEVYQQLAGRPSPKGNPLKTVAAKLMQSEAYQRAPDGDIGTKGTKLWLLQPVVSKYRSAAMKLLKRDPVVREAFLKETKRVRDAYAASRPTVPEKPKPSLGQVGQSFGVDLDALFAPAQRTEARSRSAEMDAFLERAGSTRKD